jgi:type II secretory pathway pseudopilin PulG
MVIETRRKKTDGLGFTLLELLLTVALLLALLAAVVYNFESAKRGSDLEEGARQVEALIRFAGAQAANSGKAVQLRFGEEVTVSSSTNSTSETSASAVKDIPAIEDLEDWGTKLRVVYEIDPVLQPGVFVDLPEGKAFLEAIGERVRIEKVRTPERPLNQSTNELAIVEGTAKTDGASSVTFYPDGSSETVDIFLISKEREDFREMIVRLDGVTGSVRTELRALDDLVPIEWMEDENSPQTQTSTETGSTKEPAPVETTSSATPPQMPEDPAFSEPTKNDTTKTDAFEDFPE